MKTFAKYGLLTFVAALAGFPLGYWHAQRTIAVGADILSQTLALSQYETLANLQYKQADAAHGTQAQLDLVNFMQQLDSRQTIAVRREFDYDRARALMHLALLAQQAGNDEQYQQYLHDAQKSLDDVDEKWPSEETMRTFISVADKRSKY
jgi:hypothetical protein